MNKAFLDQETPEYLQKKLEDHRSSSVSFFLMAACMGPGLWIWDYVTDPVGAWSTIWLRLSFLSLGLVAWAFKRVRSYRVLGLAAVLAMLAGEFTFVEILNRLNQGMTYGPGGFVIFMYAPLLLFAGLSLRLNLLYLLLAAAMPQLLALAGFARGFQHSHYAVLIWSGAFMMSVTQVFLAYNYKLRRNSEAELKLESRTDPLTGLSNRRHFMPLARNELARAERSGRSPAMLMLDIDHFKLVNDTYGHPTGDSVLRQLAQVFTSASRETDLVARLGGEEFAILMPETDVAEATALAERIRSTVQNMQFTSLGQVPFRLTISIGVAQALPQERSPEHLIDMADAAMYLAKTSGRNRVCQYQPTGKAVLATA